MFFKLLLLFTLVPVTELFLLLYVGQIIGIGYTIALILATGVIGVTLAKAQGFFIIAKLKQELAFGQLPGDRLLDGAFVLAGSLLLLTPGILTDVVGFIWLIPATRAPLRDYIKKRLRNAMSKGTINLSFRRF